METLPEHINDPGRTESIRLAPRTTEASRPRKQTKIFRILSVLASGRSINRFEVEPLGDHCLHSTVSAIERRYGIRVDRREEVIPGYQGHLTRCCRYWLNHDEAIRAGALLGVRD